MPVAIVRNGESPTASSGSSIAIFGIIMGWKMIFFSCVSSRVITPARPTSEPVPAVVGTAMIGTMPSVLARVHQSPMSSKSHTSPDRDHAVMAARLECLHTRAQIRFGRICLHVRKYAERDARLANAADDARDEVGLRKTMIGNQQRLGEAVCPAGLGKFGDAARTGDDARRKITGAGDLNVHMRLSVLDAKV